MPTINVTEKVYSKLLEYSSALQLQNKEKISMSDAIDNIFECSNEHVKFILKVVK